MNLVVEKFLTVKLEYLGGIPQDANVSKAVMQQKPYSILYPNSPSAKAVSALAASICNGVPVNKQERRGFANLFTSLIHRRTNK
jgi:flagellar biosynthesis protein FlhG